MKRPQQSSKEVMELYAEEARVMAESWEASGRLALAEAASYRARESEFRRAAQDLALVDRARAN
jgi:hypothetical protein